jgi:DNA-binding MarR family transcriptional regulator
MSSERNDRGALLAALHEASRRLANQNGLFTDAVAARLGLNRSDLDALSIVYLQGSVTAGELADMTGLTTGAVTGVIDRLEEGGFVRREADPADRRRVVVRGIPGRGREVGTIFEPLQKALDELYTRYTDAELAVALDLNDRSVPIVLAETARLRSTGVESRTGQSAFEGPLGNVRAGHLRFVRGVGRIVVTAEPGLPALYRASFERNAASVSAVDGVVTVQYRRSRFSWRAASGEMAINASVPWHISLNGGGTHVNFDLRAGHVTAVDITGGLSHAELWLPAPTETVPIKVTGGAHDLTFHRTRHVPVRVRVRGGVSNLRIDEQRLGAVGGAMTQQSSGYDDAAGRYDVTITGGASTLTIDSS